MRVTTDLWVAALVRRVFASGGYAAVLRRGGDSAGAIFVVVRSRLGEVGLFGPAPQSDYQEGRPHERLFQSITGIADDAAVSARVDKETRFDPDVWFVEIEPGQTPIEDLLPVRTP